MMLLRGLIRRRFASGKPIIIISPVSGQQIHRQNSLTKSQIKDLLAKTSQQRSIWQSKTIPQRRTILINYLESLRSKSQTIARDITAQTGKTITSSRSQVQDSLQVMQRHMSYKFDNDGVLRHGYSIEPYGNVTIASPYTTPFFTPCKYLMLALLVGNAVLIKSSDQCLLTTNLLSRQFKTTSNLSLVLPLHTTLQSLELILQDKDTGFINFTGLTRSGTELYKEIATKGECFAESVFHMSASDAAYVRKDADLSKAGGMLAKAAFWNSGQSRNAIKRIYVDREVMERFQEEFVREVRTFLQVFGVIFRPGDPLVEETKLPCITLASNYTALLEFKQNLNKQANIKLIYQGFISEQYKNKQFLPPLIYLAEDTHTYRFQNEQIYGPFVFLKSVDSDQTAIEEIDKSIYGKRCVIFTKDWEAGMRIGEAVEVGSYTVNNIEVHHPDLPDSGRKRSGKGFSLSEDSVRNMGKTRAIVI